LCPPSELFVRLFTLMYLSNCWLNVIGNRVRLILNSTPFNASLITSIFPLSFNSFLPTTITNSLFISSIFPLNFITVPSTLTEFPTLNSYLVILTTPYFNSSYYCSCLFLLPRSVFHPWVLYLKILVGYTLPTLHILPHHLLIHLVLH